ncbi:MAG: transketolase C-terminal domain-containing protein [Gaiellaceae bacterium]
MAELSIVEAINDAFHVELARDDSVMVIGEDIGRAGGVFRATAGLRDTFGPDRCFDTPLAEAGILGAAVGLCMAGWRPVCEMQYDAFSYPCLDQLITHVGRYRWRTGGEMAFPLVVRMPYGGGVRAPELHDDSPETYYVHTPGVKVAIPSTPSDAKGILAAAIRDPDVMVLGEDVGRAGGVFRATAGLRDRFGADRCFDTPLAEAGILGAAVGLCMAGWRPVCEMQYDAFSYPCLDQLINHVGRYRWRTGGKMQFPLVVRMPYGGGVRAPELHDDSPETYYVHTPGLKVAIPSTPADAKGIIAAAIRDPDPVVVLEPKLHYRTIRGEVPEGEHVVPLGKARLAREGTDVTLVAYGAMVPLCERAADALEDDASVEVLDVRTLKPLDEEALLASAAKTGRVVIVQEAPRTLGYAAEVAAILAEKAILDLHGPVLRVTGYDVPYPYWQIEDAYMPSVERVLDAVRKLLAF